MEKAEYSHFVIYIILIVIPLFYLFLVLPEGSRVDPEIMNGLVTASSIVFGFARVREWKKGGILPLI